METYSQKPVTFTNFWLNYCDGNHIERIIPEEQIQKLLIFFESKRYLSFKNISYPLDIEYFI